jgi:hypothetical protein
MAVKLVYLLVGMSAGVVIGTAVMAVHADDADAKEAKTAAAAEEAGVEVQDLQGAMNTTGLTARSYLCAVQEGPCPAPPLPAPAYGVWDRLAQCESNSRWNIATGNGYYGGLQFDLPSWRAAGGTGLPSQASRAEQIRVAILWQARAGWGAWPVCSRVIGVR